MEDSRSPTLNPPRVQKWCFSCIKYVNKLQIKVLARTDEIWFDWKFFRAFACQEYYYNLDGPKGDIIRETIEELCIDEDDFKCPRPYETKFPNDGTLNQKVSRVLLATFLSESTQHFSFGIPFLTELERFTEVNSFNLNKITKQIFI